VTGSTAHATPSVFCPLRPTTSTLTAAVDILPREQWMLQYEEQRCPAANTSTLIAAVDSVTELSG
jgi:hypothetical protein